MGLRRRKVSWVLDPDVRGFFDNVSHEWLVKFVEHRITDRRIIRLIQKWLDQWRSGMVGLVQDKFGITSAFWPAGVSEEGEWTETKVGTPQGPTVVD